MTEMQRNPLAKSFNTVSLIKFAFPSMVMMLFMGLYTIVDTVFVARFVDTNALSSINIVCPVINIIVGLGTMLGAGGSAIVAKKMGSGKTDEARSNFTLIIITGAITGLVITVIGILFLDEIIWGLGASEILFPYCKDYLMIQLLFVVGNIMQVLYQNLFVTSGKPTLGLILSIFVFLFSFFAGENIAKVFAENNKNVFEITKVGFTIFSFSFLFSGCNIFASALFTALSNGKASATISFLRTFGFITVFLLVLPSFLQVIGVWLAIPIAELLTLMLTIYLIFRNRKHYKYL